MMDDAIVLRHPGPITFASEVALLATVVGSLWPASLCSAPSGLRQVTQLNVQGAGETVVGAMAKHVAAPSSRRVGVCRPGFRFARGNRHLLARLGLREA